jgi:hypothetical protein
MAEYRRLEKLPSANTLTCRELSFKRMVEWNTGDDHHMIMIVRSMIITKSFSLLQGEQPHVCCANAWFQMRDVLELSPQSHTRSHRPEEEDEQCPHTILAPNALAALTACMLASID